MNTIFFVFAALTLSVSAGVTVYAGFRSKRRKGFYWGSGAILVYIAIIQGWAALATAHLIPVTHALTNGTLVAAGCAMLGATFAYHVIVEICYYANDGPGR